MPDTANSAAAPLKIAFVMGSLRMGGAERVAVDLCAYLGQRGHAVTLVNLGDPAEDYFALPPEVPELGLYLDRPAPTRLATIRNVLWRIRRLRAALRQLQPQVVLSFTDRTNIITTLAAQGIAPVVISARGLLSMEGSGIKLAARTVYRLCDRIVCVSTGVAAELAFLPVTLLTVIPNALRTVTVLDAAAPLPLPADRCRIVSLGRLAAEKNYMLLIQAFAQVAADFPHWDVQIFGDGPLRDQLLQLALELQLDERIHLPGAIQQPGSALKSGAIYVQSSDFEGFPNAVLEAMACGLPVIVTDYGGDPRMFITDGINGRIVPRGDVNALAAALRKLMQDAAERERLGQAARAVRDRFAPEVVYPQWEAVLYAATRRR